MDAKLKAKVLMPDYMINFRCIGSKCEDNCCHGRISIDKDSYQKYKNIAKRDLKESITRKIDKNNSPTAGFYDYAILDNELYCCFLDNEKFCKIQRELGEDYISCACYTVPRKINMVNGIMEKSCCLFCPEAARLVLLNPDIMTFSEFQSEESTKLAITNISSKDLNKNHPLLNEIREFVIDILQFREYSFSDRMIILSIFTYQLDFLYSRNECDELPDLISTYKNKIQSIDFMMELETKRSNFIDKTIEVFKIAHEKFLNETKTRNGVQYKECIQLYEQGSGYYPETKYEDIIQNIGHAYNKFYVPYFSERQYIFENFFVNFVFKEVFPYKNNRSIFEEFGMISFYYFVMNMTLVGISGGAKGLDDEIVLKYLHTFSRIIDNRADFDDFIYKSLKNAGFFSYDNLVNTLNIF